MSAVIGSDFANGFASQCRFGGAQVFSYILPAMTTHELDHTLMARYCAGDLLAFKELYRRHSQGVYQFIAWRAPRREWVDEIVQDSWAALHEARERYQPLAGFRTYLYQIARNRLIDLVRQKQDLLASEMSASGLDDESAFEALADSEYESVAPDAALDKKRQTAALHAAIRSLPGEQKEALVLQQFNGLSLDEIAEITAVPVETVKSRLRYAMQKLRSQLQGSQVRGAVA